MILQQCVQGNADPEALPEALPEAIPEAIPEAGADSQYMAYSEPDYPGFRPPVSEPGCGLMDTCCGMSNEGCCMGGQQCYTYYERECENINEPSCNMRGKTVCMNIPLKDCRVVKERRTEV